MVDDSCRMPKQIREDTPCKGCAERFTACYDRCPKDARGEFGYNAWKAEIARIKEARNRYLVDRYEDRKRDRKR